MGLSDDPYTAYCFDEACWTFGSYVESEMTAAENRTQKEAMKAGARQLALQTILDGGTDDPDKAILGVSKAGTQFRDPAALLAR